MTTPANCGVTPMQAAETRYGTAGQQTAQRERPPEPWRARYVPDEMNIRG